MNQDLTVPEILTRLGLAFIAGLVIGYERETHGRAAGFRTTILTCVSAAMAMILSELIFAGSTASSVTWKPDPARLAAGILTGMGFLGGAGIIRHENVVRGVTTAAVMWFVTVLGLAFGSGYLQLGFMGLGIALITLFLLPKLEANIRNDWYAVVTIKMKLDAISEEELFKQMQSFGTTVKRTGLDFDMEQQHKTISCELKFKKQDYFILSRKIIQEISRNPGVLHVRWS